MLADGAYDAIIMGTGLKEAVISGLLSAKGMKVLHVDRNGYYGEHTASVACRLTALMCVISWIQVFVLVYHKTGSGLQSAKGMKGLHVDRWLPW